MARSTTGIKNYTINKNATIKEAISKMYKKDTPFLLVLDKCRLVGRVRDLKLRKLLNEGISSDTRIEKIMVKNPLSIKGDEPIVDLTVRVRKSVESIHSTYLPVLDKEQRVNDLVRITKKGLVSITKNAPRKMKKVLLIGGAGYIGCVLTKQLLKKGYKVVVLDNLSYGDKGIKKIKGNVTLIKGDARNITDVIRSIEGVDAVIHLAAIVGDPACQSDPQLSLETNFFAAGTIARICKYHQINRMIFASTCSVYGAGDGLLTEQSSLNPISLYARTKINSEREILDLADKDFSPTIFRMATVYGWSPLMRFDLAVNYLTALALRKNKITIVGGDQWRPFINIKDVADAYIDCLEAPIERVSGKIYNLVGENMKINKLGRILKAVFKKAELIKDDRAVDERDYNVSGKKFKQELKFKPKVSMEQGVKEIAKNMEKERIYKFSYSRGKK